jgi:hypothetical protein
MPLHVLILEDREQDAELMVHELGERVLIRSGNEWTRKLISLRI